MARTVAKNVNTSKDHFFGPRCGDCWFGEPLLRFVVAGTVFRVACTIPVACVVDVGVEAAAAVDWGAVVAVDVAAPTRLPAGLLLSGTMGIWLAVLIDIAPVWPVSRRVEPKDQGTGRERHDIESLAPCNEVCARYSGTSAWLKVAHPRIGDRCWSR